MRLIDADAINFRCAYNGDCSADEESCKKCSDYVCDFEDIQNQPTAYDVEAKVMELEEASYLDWGGNLVLLRDAIEIVRGKE